MSLSAPTRVMCKGEGQRFSPCSGTNPRTIPSHPDTRTSTFTGALHNAGSHSQSSACCLRHEQTDGSSGYPVWHPGSRQARIRRQSSCSAVRLRGRARIPSRHASEVPVYRNNFSGSLIEPAARLSDSGLSIKNAKPDGTAPASHHSLSSPACVKTQSFPGDQPRSEEGFRLVSPVTGPKTAGLRENLLPAWAAWLLLRQGRRTQEV